LTPAEESRRLFRFFRLCNPNSVDHETGISFTRFDMVSRYRHLLPGSDRRCEVHGLRFQGPDSELHPEAIHVPDSDILENLRFNYYVVDRINRSKPADGVIVLFHGLNEKSWEKYLPWALRLVRGTGKPVLLFPLAFHMDRAPRAWIEPRSMSRLSRERAVRHPAIRAQSLANAALSERLEADPLRFAWSGLQSLYDILYLCRRIKAGLHPGIRPNPRIDIFAYSIGAFLALIGIMADPGNLFSKSRLFSFCGGCVLNRTVPTSRYIMDSEANIALYSLYVEHMETEMAANPRLAHYMSPMHPEGRYFLSLLDLHKMADFRERRLFELRNRIRALALDKDRVMPPMEVAYTLQGRQKRIPIRVLRRDFDYDYAHENPFPGNNVDPRRVSRALDRTFATASRFLS